MAVTQQITCDVCGKVKGQVNHWWMFNVTHVLAEEDYFNFEAKPWIDSEQDWTRHACGQECLLKALSQWMQAQQAVPLMPSGEKEVK
jgi:hypothetical protein